MYFKALFFVVALLFVLLLPLYADGIVNKKDDIEFVRGLAQWGYSDLAFEMIDKILKRGSSKDRRSVNLLRCVIKKEEAQRTFDFEAKKKKYAEARECYRTVLDSSTGNTKLEIQMDLADILVTQVNEAVEAVPEGSKKAKAVYKEVLPLLDEAKSLFEAAKATTEYAGTTVDAQNESPREKKRARDALIRYQAAYGICRTYFFRGKCGEPQGYKDCLANLDAYIWDYEGLLGAFHAMLLRGLTLAALGNYKEAITSYEGVLRPFMEPNASNHPSVQSLTIQGCYYTAKTYVLWKRFSQAIATVEEFTTFFEKKYRKKFKDQFYGQACFLEMGKAYLEQNNSPKALEIAQDIASIRSYWGFVAKQLLLEWGKRDPKALQNAKSAHLVATGL